MGSNSVGLVSTLSLVHEFRGGTIRRYERVRKTQRMEEMTRDKWHFPEIGDRKKKLICLGFDADVHAYLVCD